MASREPVLPASEQIVQVGDDWQITLPATLCQKMGWQVGDMLAVLQLDDSIILTRRKLTLPELGEEIARALAAAGVTLDDMLAGLEEEHRRSREERYGPQAQGG